MIRSYFLYLTILLASCHAIACTCISDLPPMCQQLRQYKGSALFLGRVVAIRLQPVSVGSSRVQEQVVTFSVEDLFAGATPKTVEVTSFVEPAMCGYPFR